MKDRPRSAKPHFGKLRHRGDFETVFRQGKVADVGPVQIRWFRRPQRVPNRFGIVVNKKVGGAVVRNRTKRQLRSMIRSMPMGGKGVDVVLVARGPVSGIYHDVGREIWEILEDNEGIR